MSIGTADLSPTTVPCGGGETPIQHSQALTPRMRDNANGSVSPFLVGVVAYASERGLFQDQGQPLEA